MTKRALRTLDTVVAACSSTPRPPTRSRSRVMDGGGLGPALGAGLGGSMGGGLGGLSRAAVGTPCKRDAWETAREATMVQATPRKLGGGAPGGWGPGGGAESARLTPGVRGTPCQASSIREEGEAAAAGSFRGVGVGGGLGTPLSTRPIRRPLTRGVPLAATAEHGDSGVVSALRREETPPPEETPSSKEAWPPPRLPSSNREEEEGVGWGGASGGMAASKGGTKGASESYRGSEGGDGDHEGDDVGDDEGGDESDDEGDDEGDEEAAVSLTAPLLTHLPRAHLSHTSHAPRLTRRLPHPSHAPVVVSPRCTTRLGSRCVVRRSC